MRPTHLSIRGFFRPLVCLLVGPRLLLSNDILMTISVLYIIIKSLKWCPIWFRSQTKKRPLRWINKWESMSSNFLGNYWINQKSGFWTDMSVTAAWRRQYSTAMGLRSQSNGIILSHSGMTAAVLIRDEIAFTIKWENIVWHMTTAVLIRDGIAFTIKWENVVWNMTVAVLNRDGIAFTIKWDNLEPQRHDSGSTQQIWDCVHNQMG